MDRPKHLNAIIFIIIFVDLFSFFESTSMIIFLVSALLTLVMIPIYVGLYKAQNWARIITVVMAALTVINTLVNYKMLLSGGPSIAKFNYLAETLIYFVAAIYLLVPAVRQYYVENTDVFLVKEDQELVSLVRRGLALIADLAFAGLIVFCGAYFSILFNTEGYIVYYASLFLAYVYLSIFTFLNFNLGALLNVKIVYNGPSNLTMLCALIRPIYGLLLFPLNIIYVVLDRSQRGFHDYIAHTAIVRTKSKEF